MAVPGDRRCNYRESLKNASQVVRIRGEKIAFSCLQCVKKAQLFQLVFTQPGKVILVLGCNSIDIWNLRLELTCKLGRG